MRVNQEQFEAWVSVCQHTSGIRMVNTITPTRYEEKYLRSYDDKVLAQLIDDDREDIERYYIYN